eukprot:scaffold305989_cov22-Prasinocladus_malaysianus.AAC.1
MSPLALYCFVERSTRPRLLRYSAVDQHRGPTNVRDPKDPSIATAARPHQSSLSQGVKQKVYGKQARGSMMAR